jgi:hypothetical protein
MTLLENDTFTSRGLTQLEVLRADLSGFETIELAAFNGLTKLTHLSMKYNHICEILPRTFEKMSSLENLELANNRIKHLAVDIFCGLINLKYLNLEENNLQSLHPNLLEGLPYLERVSFAINPDLKIPADRQFINSRSLTHLCISYCDVSLMSVETFANVTALELLDVSYNDIRSVDINILKALPKLSTLYLHVNPLQCDCQLQEVWRWCQDHNIQTAFEGEEPECMKPREVQFMWWGVLEKGQCLEGKNISYLGDYKNTSYSPMPVEQSNLHEDRLNFLKHIEAPVCAFPFTFGATGNVILIIIIIRNKDMRTIPNLYILNLAISDIIYLMAHFFEACANRVWDSLLLGDFTCKFLPFCRRLSVGLSVYSIALLSFQRYNVIVNPFHIRVSSQSTWRVTLATICGVWIVAALFALPAALSKDFCAACYNANCINYYQRVVMFELLVSCLLPLGVIAFSYIMTARHLVKSARPISEQPQSPQLNTCKNTAKIVVGLTVVFLISYVPYHAFWTYIVFNDNMYFDVDSPIVTKEYKLQFTHLVLACLLFINSCLNPIAIFSTSLAFRKQLKLCLTCFSKQNSPRNNLELTRRN